jgi:hypothetical protein
MGSRLGTPSTSRSSRRTSSQHCGDWIRIFGEAIEDVAKGDLDNLRNSFQSGGDYHWTKYKGDKKGDQPDAGRRRVTEPDRAKLQLQRNVEVASKDYYLPSVWGFMRDISPSAGINRWRVMENDTTGKMDQVFGLMPGATISGTTTDDIFFFCRFGEVGLDPAFFLLPLATIVAGGHHSLLEVGIPLSLNGRCKYVPGLYSTLFPEGSQVQNRPAGVGAIRAALSLAETHPTNHLMLIGYESNTPAVCYLYNNDRQKWRQMKWGPDLLSTFKRLTPWPNKSRLRQLRFELNVA